MHPTITLFHAPHSRSGAVRILLEELGAPYELEAVNLKAGETRTPRFLALNPMGKVPAVLFRQEAGDTLVAEQAAIMIWLADLFPQQGLAPAIDDPLRGPWLRWMVFHGACFEPAVIDLAMKREPAPPSMSPYGDYDTMLATLARQLRAGPWLLGERFSAADILWGYALAWTTAFKLVPELPELTDYIARLRARPAWRRVTALDAELAAAQAA
ncbi:glutathione S-transferase [Massilia sp. WF1]|uniref:glutathione S-transferase family protein n=1 Tax=unclassified Massilia TaxID=2609279 RepID=UPI00064A5670|nr:MULTISPECIES: glutathione S-transferase family protein [unclassified Massilia]ALK97272.1 glutathione S-transferase [Massilia sp. WG5]KLU36452.1 glutathione S-transferase [Massilia sp. WF1]